MQNIESLSDLENAIDLAASTHNITEIWWRGQPSDKPLRPAVFRRDDAQVAENGLIQRFIHKAQSRYSPCPSHDDMAGWLFLMQHFGLHTRILDWTESILIATYFAVNKDASNSGVVWAVNPFVLNKIQLNKAEIMSGHSDTVKALVVGAFQQNSPPLYKAAAIRPVENNLRMMLQQSTFTIHGCEKPLEEFPNSDKFLLKFVIPVDKKQLLLDLLGKLGITMSTIFPELEYLANDLCELSYRRFSSALDNG